MKMRGLLILPLLLGSCAGTASADRFAGDRLYRLGDYAHALRAYQEQAAENPSPELDVRIADTRAWILLEHAREAMFRGQPHIGLSLLETLEQVYPGHKESANLREYACERIAEDLVEVGYEALASEDPLHALDLFNEALAWSPENEAASKARQSASHLASIRQSRGEQYYFQALAELEEGNELHARRSFQHAAKYLAETAAAEQYDALSRALAEESRLRGDAFFRAGLMGSAWAEYRAANRLAPGVFPAVLDRIAEMESYYAAHGLAVRAEVAALGDRFELARGRIADGRAEQAAEAAEFEVVEALIEEREQADWYRKARSLELDNRVAGAAGLYRKLAAANAHFADIDERLSRAEQRLSQASTAYDSALAAQERGDHAAARQHLLDAIRLASDYKDARERLRDL